MTEKINFILHDPKDYDNPEIIGWIEVDSDLNVEWDFKEDHHKYPTVRASAYKHDRGEANVRGPATNVLFNEDDDTKETHHGDARADPGPRQYIKSMVDEIVDKGIDQKINAAKPSELP